MSEENPIVKTFDAALLAVHTIATENARQNERLALLEKRVEKLEGRMVPIFDPEQVPPFELRED